MCESGRLVLLVNIFYSGMNEKERPTNSSVFEMFFLRVFLFDADRTASKTHSAAFGFTQRMYFFVLCFFSVFNFSFLSIFASHSFIFSNDEENKKKYFF